MLRSAIVAALLCVANGGDLISRYSVTMPYLNPAGVTYTSPLAASPLLPRNAFVPGLGIAGPTPFAGAVVTPPAVYGAPLSAPSPIIPPRPVATRFSVPEVHHLPAVANIPITKYEAQPAVVQKLVDVAKPQFATKTVQIRRPAIQKQFFEVEERTVVRPLASALVELDQPTSRTQGPTLVKSALHTHAFPLGVAQNIHHYAVSQPGHHQHPLLPEQLPSNPKYQEPPKILVFPPQQPQFQPQEPAFPPQQSQFQPQPPAFPPQQSIPLPALPEAPSSPAFNDPDTVSIDNPELARAAPPSTNTPVPIQPTDPQPNPSPRSQIQNLRVQSNYPTFNLRTLQLPRFNLRSQTQLLPYNPRFSQPSIDHTSQAQMEARTSPEIPPAALRSLRLQPQEEHQIRPNQLPAVAREFARNVSQVVPRVFQAEQEARNNQERLLELLTGELEVQGASVRNAGESGQQDVRVRARVLSVTPAPRAAAPRETVNTRRIVVSHPVETLEEVRVVQPFTELQRIAVQQPAVIKTPRLAVAQVSTSIPVSTLSPLTYIH